MSDMSDIPRYGFRKRPANDALVQNKRTTKQKRPSPSPPQDAPSEVAPPLTPKSNNRKPRATTLTREDKPTQFEKQQQLAPKPSTATTPPPHKLTINGRTFTGPLHPTKTTDPSGNAATIPGDHNNYKLFICADCPAIPHQNNLDVQDVQNDQSGLTDIHALCYPTHPCLWSFPPKAREAFANRHHWLSLNKPLEATRRANGRLPRLLDEDGEPITRALVNVEKGTSLNKAYDEVVMRRYTAVVKSEECCEMRGVEEGDGKLEVRRAAERIAREAMLENMSWSFDW